MAMLEELTEQFKQDEPDSTPVSESTDSKVEEKVEPAEEQDTKPAQEQPAATEDKPVDEQPKPDLSQVSKEDKAAHAFKRQLSKQKEKHAQEIEELKKSFQTQFEEFKASMKPKEEPKTRKDFETDDEYIKYLNKQGLMEVLEEQRKADAEKAAKAEEDAKAAKEQEEANEQLTRTFATNSHNAFKDPAAYDAYSKTVSKALENGLGEVLDEVPPLRDFIFKNPEGPIVLNKILNNREDFVKIMSQTDPTMMIIAAHELATAPVAAVETPAPTAPQVPHIGKPGAKKVSADAGSMFNSDKDLIAYIRNVGPRRR